MIRVLEMIWMLNELIQGIQCAKISLKKFNLLELVHLAYKSSPTLLL